MSGEIISSYDNIYTNNIIQNPTDNSLLTESDLTVLLGLLKTKNLNNDFDGDAENKSNLQLKVEAIKRNKIVLTILQFFVSIIIGLFI